MTVTLILHPNRTPMAGDVVYPLRLLVTPAEIVLEAPTALRAVAEAVSADLSANDAPGALLLAHLAPVMAEMGYRPLPRAAAAIVHWTPNRPIAPVGCSGLCRLIDAPEAAWGLSHARADLPDDAWVIAADGMIAAAAWYGEAGIAVETAPSCRRRGYGYAVCAALAAARLAEGREVCYRCAETNAASIALAASLGFSSAAREYRPGFRRI